MACGDDWKSDNWDDESEEEAGCQQYDADVYCKLKSCDENAVAISYQVTFTIPEPGFSCDGRGRNLGDWLGISDVYFADNSRKINGGSGQVVSHVICGTKGNKYKFYF